MTPIDDDLDGVVAAAIELDVFFERAELAVDAGLRVAADAQPGELLLELALAAANDRREHVDALVLRVEHHHVDDPLERLAGDLLAAVRTVRYADVREQQPQVIVDFGDGADRRAGIGAVVFCSIEIAGERPSIRSTSGFSICSRNWRAYADSDST